MARIIRHSYRVQALDRRGIVISERIVAANNAAAAKTKGKKDILATTYPELKPRISRYVAERMR